MPLFTKLRVWREAHELALLAYRASESFPGKEQFGVTRQLRRAAYSVAANLVEGQRRSTNADFAHFVDMAAGSLAELQYFLLLSKDLGYLPEDDYAAGAMKAEAVERMLVKLSRALREPKPS
jgi:four helix bundle protein